MESREGRLLKSWGCKAMWQRKKRIEPHWEKKATGRQVRERERAGARNGQGKERRADSKKSCLGAEAAGTEREDRQRGGEKGRGMPHGARSARPSKRAPFCLEGSDAARARALCRFAVAPAWLCGAGGCICEARARARAAAGGGKRGGRPEAQNGGMAEAPSGGRMRGPTRRREGAGGTR